MAYNARISAIPMPDRIKQLPISDTGYPVPWFAAWFDGVPDLRVVDTPKVGQAVNRKKCWVCGGPMGRNVAFTLGPMCSINRTISEPPAHRECAVYSAQACPFLANPRMRRNDVDVPEHIPAPGLGLRRNPGAVAVWVTRGYRPFNVQGGVLFTFDDPTEPVMWFAEGRTATRAEVEASIETGLPFLLAEAQAEGPKAVADLQRLSNAAAQYLPAA